MTLNDCLKQERCQTPFSSSIYLHFEMRPARNNGEGRFFPDMSVLLQHILKCNRDVFSYMTQSSSFETGVCSRMKGVLLYFTFSNFKNTLIPKQYNSHNIWIAGKMGCNCSSDYSDSEWIENLDEICEHCNCPIAPQSCNPVSDSKKCCWSLFIEM